MADVSVERRADLVELRVRAEGRQEAAAAALGWLREDGPPPVMLGLVKAPARGAGLCVFRTRRPTPAPE